MTSNGKTLNYKFIDLVESYNFHIKFTSMKIEIWIVYRLFDYEDDFKWKKLCTTTDLVESYNFHIKFTSIRVQTKKLQSFENRLDRR
jgi:hypothetical protein